MHRIQRTICTLFMVALVLCVPAANAENFQSDFDGINRAAKSVLRLEVYNEENQLIATGSGFVAFDNYTIVTNYHVIENAD